MSTLEQAIKKSRISLSSNPLDRLNEQARKRRSNND